MSHFPDFATFSRLAQDHQLIPVYRRLVSDTLTPVSAFHKIDSGGSACLFESVIGGAVAVFRGQEAKDRVHHCSPLTGPCHGQLFLAAADRNSPMTKPDFSTSPILSV